MRRTSSLLIRWICSLALILAAMPVKASGMPCATPKPAPVAAARADCGMPCCESKPNAKAVACEEHAAQTEPCCEAKTALRAHAQGNHGISKAADPCKCELKAAPSAPAAETKATTPNSHVVVAAPPPAVPELPTVSEVAEPGIFGVDSGPPADSEHLSDFGRAPPVART